MSVSTSIPTLPSLLKQGMPVGRLPYRRCREFYSWPVTILLILNHSIWSTMQCSPSSSRSHGQPQIKIVNIPRKDDHSSNSLDNAGENHQLSLEVLSSSEAAEIADSQGQPENPFFRSIRDGGRGGQETPRLCGDRLRIALMDICERRFHDPSKSRSQSGMKHMKRSILLSRVPRTVVNECCKKPCNETSLIKYCNEKNGPPPQHKNSSQTVERQLSVEANVADEKEQGSHPNSTENGELEEIWIGSNAVTQPIPSKMIPLGSLANDYRIKSVPTNG